MIDPELQVSTIFFRQRGNRQRNAWKVDPLMLAQRPSVEHFAENVFPRTPRTRSSIRPSLSRIRAPAVSSRARSGKVVEMRAALPARS